MNYLHRTALAAVVATLAMAAQADTIINLNATVANGPSVSGGGTPNALAPSYFNTTTFGPGTYTVSIIGSGTPGAVYNGWSQGYGSNGLAGPGSWQERTGFSLGGGSFSTVAGNNIYTPGLTDQLLFKNGTGSCSQGNCYDSAAAALAGFASSPYTFTLATATPVTFYIPDQSYPIYPGFTDNTGGVSLAVKSVTPEPSSLFLLATGVMAAAGVVKRKLTI